MKLNYVIKIFTFKCKEELKMFKLWKIKQIAFNKKNKVI